MLVELFSAIVSDPVALPLWAVAAMAAVMYPLGLMLGAECRPCCDACYCEEGDEMPETITATLNGFTDKSQGPNLCTLSFSACYGSGAAGHVTAPGGDPATDAGPVSAVTLSSPGSGYAKLGRIAPTVTATGSGSGATFDVTLTQSLDDCDVDQWKVTKVAVTDPGSGYVHDEALTFTVAAGDTQEVAAIARLQTERGEPAATLEVTSAQGSGAAFTVVFSSIGGTPPVWAVDSVTVDDGGDLYVTGDPVTFTKSPTTIEVLQAAFTAKATHTLPTVSAYVDSATGAGAVVSVTLSSITQGDGSAAWEVSAVAIENAGSGYSVYDFITVEVTDGISTLGAAAYVDSVDASGAIQSFTIENAGIYFKGGPINEIFVDFGGRFFEDTGEAKSVVVDNGGVYYREDSTLPPYVAEVTVTIDQTPPSAGAGAVISATVNDDPESAGFGTIESPLSIDNGGADYLAWQWLTNDCCGHQLNGVPIVLARHDDSNAAACNIGSYSFYRHPVGKVFPSRCVYTTRFCGGWKHPFTTLPLWNQLQQYKTMQLSVAHPGAYGKPMAKLTNGCGSSSGDINLEMVCARQWFADSAVDSCADFSWSQTNEDGTSISVSPGGNYDSQWRYAGDCSVCCQGAEERPAELTVEVEDLLKSWPLMPDGTQPGDLSGTYVLSKYGDQWNGGIANILFLSVRIGMTEPYFYRSCARPLQDGLEDCENCIKKCITGASAALLYYNAAAFYDARYLDANGMLHAGSICDLCEPTPICRPAEGTQFEISRVPSPAVPNSAVPAFVVTVQ